MIVDVTFSDFHTVFQINFFHTNIYLFLWYLMPDSLVNRLCVACTNWKNLITLLQPKKDRFGCLINTLTLFSPRILGHYAKKCIEIILVGFILFNTDDWQSIGDKLQIFRNVLSLFKIK